MASTLSQPRPRQPDFLVTATVFLFLPAALAAAWILYSFDPATASFYPSCPFLQLTGWQCAGCGSLRGLHQLLHGNFAAALHLNPLMVISLPFLVFGWVMESFQWFTDRPLLTLRLSSRWVWAYVALLVGFTIVRNLV